jgi:hypothetical protein
MRHADKIRLHGRERYVLPARERGEARFSIRAGDVVHALGMNGRTPAVCSALRTHQFLRENRLRLVETSGPKSGQSTTVIFTYEFVDGNRSPSEGADAWARLRGALKDIFSEAGGGEAYLRSERRDFHSREEGR